MARKNLVMLHSLATVVHLVVAIGICPASALYLSFGSSLRHDGITLPVNGTDGALLPANFSASAPAFSSSPVFLSLSELGRSRPECRGKMFGHNLDLVTCYQAAGKIPQSQIPVKFGDRGYGYDIQLPRRFSSPDGTCVIDIFHKDGASKGGRIYDIATGDIIKQEARRVIDSCVREEAGSGGYVGNVGKYQNLVIVVSAYNTKQINCYGNPVPILTDIGQRAIDTIPYSWEDTTFGPRGRKDVEVITPKNYAFPSIRPSYFDIKVAVADSRAAKVVTGRWWDLWTAAVAINTLCVRKSMDGSASASGGLSITIRSLTPRLGSDPSAASNFTTELESS